MKLARSFAIWFGMCAFLLVLVGAMDDKPVVHQQTVLISAENLGDNVVSFKTVLPAKFYGVMHGKYSGKIQKCEAVTEEVAELKNGGKMQNLILHCPDSDIVVTGVQFQN